MITKSNEMWWWTVFLIGGLTTIFVTVLTVTNLSEETIFNVLLPGSAIGLLLMGSGRFGAYKSSQVHSEMPMAIQDGEQST